MYSINLLNGSSVNAEDVHFDPDSYTFYTEGNGSDRTDITKQLKLTDMKTIGEPYGFDQNEYLRRLSASGGTDHVATGDDHGPKETSDASVLDASMQDLSGDITSVENAVGTGVKAVGTSADKVLDKGGTAMVNASEAAKNVTKPLSLVAIAAIVLAAVFVLKGPKL